MIKVVKFGGSSLADAVHFRQVAEIIKSEPARRYVVVSAPGKRFSEDEKVTDMLLSCHKLAQEGADTSVIFEKLESRYQEIIDGLGLNLSLHEEFAAIKTALAQGAGRDYLASRGEYLNGIVMSHYLGVPFIDPQTCIFFNASGVLDGERTNQTLGRLLQDHERAVIPGFYGAMPDGTIRTFSRGGSDVTGAIVARAALAEVYENWTDVSGMLMADPRQVENPKGIDEITYSELRELAYMGATVLHEDAIFPVRQAGIPINIRNTNRPQDPGTMIVQNAEHTPRDVITGLAGRTGFSVLHIEKDMMNTEIGFGRRVLQVLENHGISFEHLPTGIDTLSVVVATADLKPVQDQLISDLMSTVNPDVVTVSDEMAMIAVVGRGMVRSEGTAARVFTALSAAQINIRMIDQGSSELNIIVGIEASDFVRAINAIYHEFVK